ncbi:helix-turn-helix domain-containing protein [Nisaea sediminum]|uniref:helix-turn-helix domain-containing protein n=1 Tax=Nisaea sediminum TaxID=2775867 RepID=UPI001865DA17|nr:helix-turn-helix domain-containing protein [Nisaea sediminum]
MFGPKNDEEKLIFAVEDFKAEIQYEILRAMNAEGLNQKTLSKKMGISAARVSQILDDEANLTTENITKVFYAMGYTPTFSALKQKAAAGNARTSSESKWQSDVIARGNEPRVKAKSDCDVLERLIATLSQSRTSHKMEMISNDNAAARRETVEASDAA